MELYNVSGIFDNMPTRWPLWRGTVGIFLVIYLLYYNYKPQHDVLKQLQLPPPHLDSLSDSKSS